MEIQEFEEFFRLMYPKLVRYAQRTVDPTAAEGLAAAALQTMWSKGLGSPQANLAERSRQSFAYRMVEVLAHDVDEADWPVCGQPVSVTDRDVVELVVDGYKVAEIAVILDCKPGAVTVRLQRAKKNAKLLWSREVKRERQQ